MNLDFIVLGLGNPGPKYAFTRHNVGFMALDLLAQDLGSKFKPATTGLGKELQAEVLETEWKGKKILLVKPLTFMNLSGQTLSRLYMKFGHLKDTPVAALHDEVDIEFGKVRVKNGGGDAGHNGLKSMRAALGHGDFDRIRMGVGRPPADSSMELRDYVLHPFGKKEEETLYQLLDKSVKTLGALLEGGLSAAQVEASKV